MKWFRYLQSFETIGWRNKLVTKKLCKIFSDNKQIQFYSLFCPSYIKGNGIKDLYLIKVARVGSKQEAHPECPDNDYRLIFEVDFIKHFFKEYKPVHLNIWHTFTDTILSELLKMKEL